ncbi:MAG: LytTR family transcriptional regulator DNA-binding domain-containing protein, partial [Bacteroidales bacterium]|nr:LytTR family transcriptional regulator DNA-binding domain-containing protein [Bacteroidales bacterium]
ENPEFIRCHRTSIVNSSYILNMTNSYKGHRLQMLDIEEEIPVSRQYILGIKDVLDDG